MTQQYPFIDMHTHLFNARYLPIHGILLSAGVKSNHVARGLAGLANSITSKSKFDGIDEDLQEDLVQALLNRDADKLMNSMTIGPRRLIYRFQKQINRSNGEKARFDEMLEALDDLDQGLGNSDDHAAPLSNRLVHGSPINEHSLFGGEIDESDEIDKLVADAFALAGEQVSADNLFEEATHLDLGDQFAQGTSTQTKKIGINAETLGKLRQVLLFLGVMTLSEKNKYRILERDYGKGKPANGFDASYYVGVLMDMQEAYAELHDGKIKKPYFSIEQQMQRMKSLAGENGVKLISFGAVDPFRTDWQSKVESGRKLGISGFKIYCPLGYRPIDFPLMNHITPVRPGSKHEKIIRERAEMPVSSEHAQKAVGKIIPYFSQNKLRLYTHCTPKGFQAQNGFGIYSDPYLWQLAMENADAKDLWLYLAHAGGVSDIDWFGWAAKTDTDFKQTFAYRAIQLVQKHENVYLGLGNIFQFINADRDHPMRQRLKQLIGEDKPEGANHHFRDKICYGTDWSMPDAIGRTRAYLSAFYRFFEEEGLEQHAPAFFEGNARKYLGLDNLS